jgi:hypothetical protein
MNHRRILFARAAAAVIFSLALAAGMAPDAIAGVSIHVSSGHAGYSHGHRPRYSHGVPFIKRRHYNRRGYHQPHHFRSHRHRFYGHGHRRDHVLSSGCSPGTQSYRDRHGRLVIHHVSVCYDSYGRRYMLGGLPDHH